MAPLADLPELVGFFSYSRDDDVDSHGDLSALRNRIQGELRGQLGRTAKTFRLWQDKEAIASGSLWESEIKNAVAQSVFFIPIITPTVVASPFCRLELESFLAREAVLGRSDLVFPILYIDVPALQDSARRQNDAVLSLIARRQYVDWREFRYQDINSTEVRKAIGQFCMHIRDALHRPWVSPEEHNAPEEAAALDRAERERQRQETEAKAKRREEETRRLAAELEAEQQRLAAEAKAKERAKEEQRRRDVEAEESRRAAERREAEARHRADEMAFKRRGTEQDTKDERRDASDRAAASGVTRWTQLGAVSACMILIANLQYGWSLFVNPMNSANGWRITDIQLAFTIFITLEIWLTPIEGWAVDRLGPWRGPKLVVAFGGVMIALGWIVNSIASSLLVLFLGAAISGIGGGAVYATSVGHAAKWFPDRRGLAVGFVTAAYGVGAALTVTPIGDVIRTSGYTAAFFWFGLFHGGVVLGLAWLLRGPGAGQIIPAAAAAKVIQTTRSYRPLEALQSPVFWILYLMFVTVSGTGLVATAKLALAAADLGLGFTASGPATIAAIFTFGNVAAGASRPLFGWISDHIGREYTMAIAFSLAGLSYLLGLLAAPLWFFVIITGLIFLTWGSIYSLFPAICADSFGPKFATANLSMLYTAKGASALLAPLVTTLDWHIVFLASMIMNFAVAGLTLWVLRPLRQKTIAATNP
jgi:OFA family oxalate/formate antiporter-like MFS transporter